MIRNQQTISTRMFDIVVTPYLAAQASDPCCCAPALLLNTQEPSEDLIMSLGNAYLQHKIIKPRKMPPWISEELRNQVPSTFISVAAPPV